MSKEVNFDLNELAEEWGSPLVARSEVGRFSGGLLNPRTMANLDSLGKGPEKVKIGARAVYPTRSLIAWMKSRIENGGGRSCLKK